VQAEFPDKGVATAEEGRCLWDAGYDVLDVRALAEIESNANTPCPNPAAPGKADGTHPSKIPLLFPATIGNQTLSTSLAGGLRRSLQWEAVAPAAAAPWSPRRRSRLAPAASRARAAVPSSCIRPLAIYMLESWMEQNQLGHLVTCGGRPA